MVQKDRALFLSKRLFVSRGTTILIFLPICQEPVIEIYQYFVFGQNLILANTSGKLQWPQFWDYIVFDIILISVTNEDYEGIVQIPPNLNGK